MQMKPFGFLLLLLLLFVSACPGSGGAGAVRRAPPASLEARQVSPVDWSRRSATDPLWPTGTRRLQVVITPAWAEGELFVWLVANGTTVHRVFRVSSPELPEVLGGLTRPTVQSPAVALWNGGAGSGPIKPTPDPPPAPILPPGYVDAVMRLAWELNTQVAAGY